jgi:hypothetical protein
MTDAERVEVLLAELEDIATRIHALCASILRSKGE